MKFRRSVWMGIACLPLLLALAAGFGRDPHAVPSVLVGKAAPNFELTALDGSQVTLAKLRGKPVLLNFWATWCYPCQSEHPLLQQVAKQLGDEAAVLGIVYQDEAAQVRSYLGRHPSPYRHLMDNDSHTAIDYGVAGVPESFIIDANGIIVYKHAGVLTAETLKRHLAPLLAASAVVKP